MTDSNKPSPRVVSIAHLKPMGRIEGFLYIREGIRRRYGSQKQCARMLGISESHLSDALNARCEFPPKLLDDLGLRRKVVFDVIDKKKAFTLHPDLVRGNREEAV